MVAKSTDKQVSFFLDEKDRDQWQKLCKTSGISSSMVLRSWILSALQKQKIDVEVAPEQVSLSATKTIDNSKFDGHTRLTCRLLLTIWLSRHTWNSIPFRVLPRSTRTAWRELVGM